MLRQQADHADSRPNRSLADFVAPVETGLVDHVGAFAVTAGLGADELADGFEAEHDDYRSIMVKALADRLAEAFAEFLHEVRPPGVVRAERRPALERRPDRGALPRHPPRVRLPGLPRPLREARALRAPRRRGGRPPPDRQLRHDPGRERFSGIYLGHPAARYFSVGRIARDQAEDYAGRLGVELREAERWLSPNLAYDPD